MRQYKFTNSSISFFQYHLVFCPRYRRKIFNIEGVKERFEEVTASVCKEHNIDILAIECNGDYVHLHVNAAPNIDAVHLIKSATSKALKAEFQELSSMTSLWTKQYLVTSEPELSPSILEEYVLSQKTRP